MKSTLFASAALTLVLSTGDAFAAGPTAEMTDTGDTNTSYIEQKAGSTDSAALIEQAGSKNKQSSSPRSFSAYNYGAAIVQNGAGDTGHIKQRSYSRNWVMVLWERRRIEVGGSLPEPPEGAIRHDE